MKKHKVIIFAAVLAVITILAAILHLNTREFVAKGTIQLTVGNQAVTLDISKLNYKPVTGVRINGKGEEIPVDGLGIALKEVFTSVGVTEYAVVHVVSDDSYRAELTDEEVDDGSKAFLLVDEKNSLRLVVFGDTNSKRSVSNVAQIIVE